MKVPSPRIKILLLALATLAASVVVGCGSRTGDDRKLDAREVSVSPPDGSGFVVVIGDPGALLSGTEITVKNIDQVLTEC